MVSVRVKEVEGLDSFRDLLKENRSGVIRELLDEGKKMKALQLFREKKVSIGLGAKLAGVTLSEFFDLLAEYNISHHLTLEDAKASMETARKVL